MRLVAVLCVALAACGARRAPPLDPESFLFAGVDPRTECDAERDALAHDGFAVVRRIDEPGVCALGLATRDGRRTAVRVVTGRGVQLTRDGDADAVPPSPPVSLVPPPAGTPPSREVLVGRGDVARARTCLEVVRVLDDGTASAVPVELAAILDRVSLTDDLCIEAVRDVDGDGRVEALVVVRVVALARASTLAGRRAPEVAVPLAARGEALGPLLALPDYWRAENARRQAALARARAALEVDAAYTLAVELAVVALLSGEGRTAALGAYDDALRGLVLDEGQARFVAAARETIALGLRAGGP